MIKPLTFQHEWDWVKERAHCIQCEDSRGIVGYSKDGSIAAVAIFDSFTLSACNVHMAIDNPQILRHGFLQEIAYFTFVAMQRKKIFGLVPSNNAKALRLNTHIGMTEVARIPEALAEGIDYIVLELAREDCRWLPKIEEAA